MIREVWTESLNWLSIRLRWDSWMDCIFSIRILIFDIFISNIYIYKTLTSVPSRRRGRNGRGSVPNNKIWLKKAKKCVKDFCNIMTFFQLLKHANVIQVLSFQIYFFVLWNKQEDPSIYVALIFSFSRTKNKYYN